MRILPKPWEGSHPAFPKTPEPLAVSGIWTPALVGSISGLLMGATRRLLRAPFANGGNTLSSVGCWTAVASAAAAFLEVRQNELAKQDIYPLLEAEGIEIPRRKFFERSNEMTRDDAGVIGAAVGLLLYPMLRRPLPAKSSFAPTFNRVMSRFGAASLGATSAFLLFTAVRFSACDAALRKNIAQDAIAKRIYEQKTGRKAPDWLYQHLLEPEDVGQAGVEIPLGAHLAMLSANAGDELFPTTVSPQPPGSNPHHVVIVNGKTHYLNTRDYLWRPANSEEGLRLLHEQLNDLNGKRSSLVQTAEFLWIEIAKRERKYMKENEPDTTSGRQLRKTLELLSSMHSNIWTEISEIDWLIADTKKIILQVQKAGDWIPDKPLHIDLKTYKPERVLELVRQHKEKMAQMLSHMDSLIVTSESDQLKREENLKEIKENDIATGELLRELEERVQNSDARDVD